MRDANALPPAKPERETSAPSAGRQLERICNGDKVEALALYQKMKLHGSSIWDAEFEALKPANAIRKP